MKRLFTLIALFAVVLSMAAQTRNVFEWKDNRVTIRTTTDVDSITFSLPEDAVIFTTGNPSVLTENSMTASFALSTDLTISNPSSTTEQGVCYSLENEEPTVDDYKVKYGNLYTGTWQCTLSGLLNGLKYYYRPYLKVADVVFYGSVKSFTTLGDYVELPYVDLGLPSGTLWADRNVGAESPEDYGDYFAWGETEPKSVYDWSTYKWCKGTSSSLTKYCDHNDNGYNGFIDHKSTLELSDDAAYVNMGSNWSMPTRDQLSELVDKCTWTSTTQRGTKGIKVTGPNGNSIFLPNATYWSSSSHVGNFSYYAYYLYYNGWDFGFRSDGNTVRAVVRNPITEHDVLFTTGDPTDITEHSMTASFALSIDISTTKPSINTEQGVCYSSKNEEPTVDDSKVKYGDLYEGTWQCTLYELFSCSQYYYRPYLKVGDEVFYGSVKSFTTLGDYVEFPSVDLGLPSGTLWADRNVGAESPEDYGDYFAWGETEPKSVYDWGTYKWCNGASTKLTKYCKNSTSGYNSFTDCKESLDLSDDAAYVNMGSNWCIPTQDQLSELVRYCTWTWDGDGYRVTGPNGKSIFLPDAGYLGNRDLSDPSSEYSTYWSSSLDEGNMNHYAHCLIISFDLGARCGSWFRDNGRTVRAVVRNPITEHDVSFTTGDPTDITENSMTASFALSIDISTTKPSINAEQGVCYSSKNEEPTVDDSKVKYEYLYEGTWQCTLSGLLSGSKYYYRPYLKVGDAVFYGSVKSFTTLGDYVDVSPNAVDLGLSSGTFWADRNVGAESPEDYGDYFAWGETEPKSSYDWETYKWCNGSSSTMTKYCTDSNYGYNGFTDNKTTLELSDDAAYVNMGSNWCMPTYDQLSELRSECTWTWTTQSGTEGYKVTGPNGNSIFLPAAGCYNNGYLYFSGINGSYWIGSLYEGSPAYFLNFVSDEFKLDYGNRYCGLTVRAVVR